MRKFYIYKAISFAAVLAVVFIGFFLFKQDRKEIVNENVAPIKQVEENTVPISISTQNIEEENFTGTMPIIHGSARVAQEAQSYIEKRIGEFRTQANTDVPDMREKFGTDALVANYAIDIDATYIKGGKTESIVISEYAYTGGANGNSSYKVITASTSDGKILSLTDIIKRDKQTAFTEFVKKELKSWRPEGGDASVVFEDAVKDLTFNSFKNWSLDDENLTIYFSKYEIGPGVLGAVAFPLSLEKIKDFLDPNFL